jgi:hypothetical protein
MNTVPARKPVAPKRPQSELKEVFTATEPVELPTARSPPSAPLPVVKGVLVLTIAATPHSSTVAYIDMMLKRGSYSGIVIIGNAEQETELKQLKMNIYALLGKMSLEVGVHLELQKTWTESDISTAVSKAIQESEVVNGVLCSPCYDGNRSVNSDILSMDEDTLQWPWRYSVGFLHGTAKSLLPRMRPKMGIGRANVAYFLVTEPQETTALSHLYETTCENIVTQLADTSGYQGLTIAYAQDILIPEPEPLNKNGSLDLSAQAGPIDSDVGAFDPEDSSPTKLWGMWAMQDEIGTVN